MSQPAVNSPSPLLTDEQMASFVARGFLRFDAAVPGDINQQFMREAGEAPEPEAGCKLRVAYGALLAQNAIPEIAPGIPLSGAYPEGGAVRRLLDLPLVRAPSTVCSAIVRCSITTSCT